jgi:hypothetical protein
LLGIRLCFQGLPAHPSQRTRQPEPEEDAWLADALKASAMQDVSFQASAMNFLHYGARLVLAGVIVAVAGSSVSLARPNPGGLGGPASGAGVLPGAGFGAAGPGLYRRPGVGAGGVGGPASGAGVLPGAGVGEAGVGLEAGPEVNPGGLGGPASGAGVRPGAGFGAPGAGLYRR